MAACPANLVTADEIWQGQCLDQGTFTTGPLISGITTDATRYVHLKCASGASFRDKAGVRTTALHYNTANGVTVAQNGTAFAFGSGSAHSLVEGLQLRDTGYAATLSFGDSSCTAKDCIITAAVGGNVVTGGASGASLINCLVEFGAGTSGGGTGAVNIIGSVEFCTIVCTVSSSSANALHLPYNNTLVKNTAVFGFTAFTDSTPPAGSDYNATDLSSAVTGTHNQTSLSFAAQFTSTTNDFRALSTGSLKNGTPDTAVATDDISATARDATTPYIGAWEASAAAVSFTVTPSTIPAGHSGSITLTLAGTGTTWTSGSTVSVTNSVTGTTTVTKGTWTRSSNTAATLTVTTAAGAGTWKITVDGTDSPSLTVATAALAVSPTTGTVSTTPTITLTGTNTLWTTETAAGLFTVSGVAGCSIATPTVTTNTAATAVLTLGSTTGTLTITDTSTGKTCTFAVNAVSGSITVTSPVQWQTYQRDATGFGSGHASIPIVGTYTGGPGTLTIEASFNGGSFATIATGSGGNFSGTLSTQAAGQGTLTVRFVNATGISTTVSTVGIGDVFVLAGQSNMVGVLSALQTYTNGSGLKAAAYDTTAWVEGKDYLFASGLRIQGSPWPLMASHHMNDQGVPCAFLACAVGGRSLAVDDADHMFFTKFRPDTGVAGGTAVSFGPGYSHMTTVITNSGVNGVKAVLWYQGENDADASVTQNVYEAGLISLANNLAADVAGAPKLFPVVPGGDSTPAFYRPLALAISGAVALGGNLRGLASIYDFSNDLHISTQQEGQNAADRSWAMLKSELFGGTSGNGHGPRVTSCQYNATRTTVTVCFDVVLKTGLTFSASAWGVVGNGTPAVVSSVAYHATNTRAVVLTLSGAASLPILTSFADLDAPAGLTVPLGPDFTLPGGAGTINLPAEPFKNMVTAAAEVVGGGGGGALFLPRGFGGGVS